MLTAQERCFCDLGSSAQPSPGSLLALSPQSDHLCRAADYWSVALPDLIPRGQMLIIHPTLRTLTLFSTAGDQEPIRQQTQVSQQTLLLLLCLFEAYPQPCPYDRLLACLPPKQESKQERTALYWAARRLRAALSPFDLLITAIPAVGYLLLPARRTRSVAQDDLPAR